MGLVGGKILLGLAALLVIAGWGIGNGYVRWESDAYKCYGGLGFYSEVPKQRLITIGRLHVYYQPYSFGCPQDRRFDPRVYRVENGELTPVTPQSAN
jgi:hypothetical protein